MKILMTGGTGFVGKTLAGRLIQEGHEIAILVRSQSEATGGPAGVKFIDGDPTMSGPWQQGLQEYDGIINLAGASIFSRWTEDQKKAIRESRISTTRNIVNAIDAQRNRAVTLISTSAVGYYGFHGDEELTEDSPPGNDFLAGVAREWEEEALRAREKGARVIITRFGIVLGKNGGALGQMVPLFKSFVGGPIGSGKQWFSWVHMVDLVNAFVFLLSHPELSGPFNICSPMPVRNKDLARAIGAALHRPSFMPAPAFMVKLILGEFGSVILKGQKVIPRRLLDSGFSFEYPDIVGAVQGAIRG